MRSGSRVTGHVTNFFALVIDSWTQIPEAFNIFSSIDEFHDFSSLLSMLAKIGAFFEEDAFREGTIGKIDIVVKSNSSLAILSGKVKCAFFC
jgi:hypothetical protein